MENVEAPCVDVPTLGALEAAHPAFVDALLSLARGRWASADDLLEYLANPPDQPQSRAA